MFGDGSGDLSSPEVILEEAFARMVTSDINGDNHIDIICTAAISERVKILLGDGMGSFISYADFLSFLNPGEIIPADFNNDSFVDLAVANVAYGGLSYPSRNLTIFIGDGTGGFVDFD